MAAAIRSSVSKFTAASLRSTPFDGEDEEETDPPLCDRLDIARVVTIFKRKVVRLKGHNETRTRTRKKSKNEEDQSLTQNTIQQLGNNVLIKAVGSGVLLCPILEKP